VEERREEVDLGREISAFHKKQSKVCSWESGPSHSLFLIHRPADVHLSSDLNVVMLQKPVRGESAREPREGEKEGGGGRPFHEDHWISQKTNIKIQEENRDTLVECQGCVFEFNRSYLNREEDQVRFRKGKRRDGPARRLEHPASHKCN
jgi:hypothetical protein